MLTITDLWKSFGVRDLFRGAELGVGARDRIALVGPNGSGKTTLLNIVSGEDTFDRGEVRLPKSASVGYLRQETDDLRGRTLKEEVLLAVTGLRDAEHSLAILEAEMAETPAGPELDRLILEYGRTQDRFLTLGGFDVEHEADKVLAGLGFRASDSERPTESFSGGWMMRIALAKLLLTAPDLLLLDEPTNHLDLESMQWLERFLKGYEGAIMFVSHDRAFMNALAGRVVEIEGARLVSYTGDYDEFVDQKELVAQQTEAAARNQQRRVARTQEFIDRFRAKASKARQVQSRIKMLERLERIEAPRPARRSMGLAFPRPPRAGRVVLELRGVEFGYSEKPVYSSLDIVIERTHKAALVGPNGAGKTTLLKLAAGVLEPQAGARAVGYHLNLAYFAQHQIEALDPSKRVIEELEGAVPSGVEVRARSILGRFLFSGDDVDKKVAVLSGGERTRLALAKLLVSRPNMLCLDEPTNHLDIQSRAVVEEALVEYEGALLLITHDRHLIGRVANRIVEVIEGKITEYHGDYDYYLFKKAQQQELPPPATRPGKASQAAKSAARDRRRAEAEERAKSRAMKNRLERIEQALDRASAEEQELGRLLADPQLYRSGEDIPALVRRYEAVRRRVERLESDWERIAGSLDVYPE